MLKTRIEINNFSHFVPASVSVSGIFFALLFGGIFYPPAAAADDDDDDDNDDADDGDDDDGVRQIFGFPYW